MIDQQVLELLAGVLAAPGCCQTCRGLKRRARHRRSQPFGARARPAAPLLFYPTIGAASQRSSPGWVFPSRRADEDSVGLRSPIGSRRRNDGNDRPGLAFCQYGSYLPPMFWRTSSNSACRPGQIPCLPGRNGCMKSNATAIALKVIGCVCSLRAATIWN